MQRFLSIFGILFLFSGFIFAQQDSTPLPPASLRLRIFTLDQAYYQAGDYHNKKFARRWNSSPHYGSFVGKHLDFLDQWIKFNYNLRIWKRKLRVDAAKISSSGTRIRDLETIRTGKMVLGISRELVESAAALTKWVYSPELQQRWKEFVRKLEKLENTIQELEEW